MGKVADVGLTVPTQKMTQPEATLLPLLHEVQVVGSADLWPDPDAPVAVWRRWYQWRQQWAFTTRLGSAVLVSALDAAMTRGGPAVLVAPSWLSTLQVGVYASGAAALLDDPHAAVLRVVTAAGTVEVPWAGVVDQFPQLGEVEVSASTRLTVSTDTVEVSGATFHRSPGTADLLPQFRCAAVVVPWSASAVFAATTAALSAADLHRNGLWVHHWPM